MSILLSWFRSTCLQVSTWAPWPFATKYFQTSALPSMFVSAVVTCLPSALHRLRSTGGAPGMLPAEEGLTGPVFWVLPQPPTARVKNKAPTGAAGATRVESRPREERRPRTFVMMAHNGRLKRLISQVIGPLTIHIWPCIVTGMARKKISTTIYITPEQSARLKELHDKTKVPVAEFIRQGIDMVLERESRHLAGQLSLDILTSPSRLRG